MAFICQLITRHNYERILPCVLMTLTPVKLFYSSTLNVKPSSKMFLFQTSHFLKYNIFPFLFPLLSSNLLSFKMLLLYHHHFILSTLFYVLITFNTQLYSSTTSNFFKSSISHGSSSDHLTIGKSTLIRSFKQKRLPTFVQKLSSLYGFALCTYN